MPKNDTTACCIKLAVDVIVFHANNELFYKIEKLYLFYFEEYRFFKLV